MNNTVYTSTGSLNLLSSIYLELYTFWYLIWPIVAFVNNLVVILIFSHKKQIFITTSQSIRIDYLILASSDIFIMTAYYFTKWLGMQLPFIIAIFKIAENSILAEFCRSACRNFWKDSRFLEPPLSLLFRESFL